MNILKILSVHTSAKIKMETSLKRTLASILLGISILTSPVKALAKSTLEISPEAFYYIYDEPLAYRLNQPNTENMSENEIKDMEQNKNSSIIFQGQKKGLNLKYTFQPKNSKYYFSTEGNISKGKVNYSSSDGVVKNIPDFSFDTRAIIGKTSKKRKLYAGLGLRYLQNNSQGKETSKGYWGYKREQNYYYGLIGTNKELFKKIELNLEYNHLFFGNAMATHRTTPNIKKYNHTFQQFIGAGARANLRFSKSFGKIETHITPFTRSWIISQSLRNEFGYCEPANFTIEAGIKAGAKF